MATSGTTDIYKELGIKRVISGLGHKTVLGGSILTPKVMAAIEESNRYFVEMEELLDKAGKYVARLIGCEAAYITSGGAAGLALGAAAIMAGSDPEKIAQLPDTTGMKNEFLIQKRMRYRYDRLPTIVGGKLVEVGDEGQTTPQQLEAAIGPRTAAVYYLYSMDNTQGIIPLAEVARIAKKHGLPVLLDAAHAIYPLDQMNHYSNTADLASFGGKYFGGPTAVGILAGRKDLVEAASLQGHIAYETKGPNGRESRAFGRPMKVERQLVIALVVALREWLTMNHEERFQAEEQRAQVIVEAITELPYVKTETTADRWVTLRVVLDEAALGKTAQSIVEALKDGDPSIWVGTVENAITILPRTLGEGDEQLVAERLREALTA